MRNLHNRFMVLLMCLLFVLLCVFPQNTYATPPSIPSIMIEVNNAPSDLNIDFLVNENWVNARKGSHAWETYFSYSSSDKGDIYVTTIKVIYGGTSYEIDLPPKSWGGTQDYFLNLSTRTLTDGYYPGRIELLVGIRYAILMIFQCILFLLFGFKKIKSWMIFLLPNLLMQSLLAWAAAHGFDTYWIWLGYLAFGFYMNLLNLIPLIVVLILTILPIFLVEHTRNRRLLYIGTANLLELILVAIMDSFLPILYS